MYLSLLMQLGVLVSAGLLSRQVELRAIHEFLHSAAERTSGLVIEGEAGIGKTTLWLAAQDDARARGFEVLSARVGESESVLAYAAVADLLGDLDPAILSNLPDLQRRRSGPPASQQHRGPGNRSTRGRRGVYCRRRTRCCRDTAASRHRQCAVAGYVQPDGPGVRRAEVQRPGRRPGHRAVRSGRRDLADVVAPGQAGRC